MDSLPANVFFLKPEREEGVDLTSSDTESLNAQA